jgi:hypothetical protein
VADNKSVASLAALNYCRFDFVQLSEPGTISCFDEIESEGRQVGRSRSALFVLF